MSGRISWLWVALPLCASACADILQFKDFQSTTGDDASLNVTPDSTSSGVGASDADSVTVDARADAGSRVVDASTDAIASGDVDAQAEVLAADANDAACPAACPLGAVCDNGACACRDAPNMCMAACVDLATDPNHCGSCTATCPSGASCSNGVCACPAAQPMACGGGCVDIKTDHGNCGGCGTACPANLACHNAVCTACATSSTDRSCSGVCVDVSSDVKNCGSCGRACPSGATCMGSNCACPASDPTACAVVGGDGGACIDTMTDRNNCGGCANVCKLAHTNSGCNAAKCAILSCTAGYADCDRTASNGCEIHTAGDPNNCAACGNVCSLAHATAGCSGSTCVAAVCAVGYGNCDGIDSNGCEVNTRTDRANCGACSTASTSHACAVGKVCRNAICGCPVGMHDCSGTCVSDSVISSCGAMCTACLSPKNGMPTCSGVPPVCGALCGNSSFPLLCGGACVNPLTDNNNCGGCGPTFACSSGLTCVGGVCVPGMDGGVGDAATE